MNRAPFYRTMKLSTIKRQLVLIVLAAVFLWFGSARAQEDDGLLRIQDQQLTTREDRERALTQLLDNARESRNASQWTKAAALMNRAGYLQFRLHQPEPALTTFNEVRSMLDRSTDSPAYIDSLNGTAAIYTHLSKCSEARATIEQSIDLSGRINYAVGKAEALLLLSDCQNYKDADQAIRTAQESLALWQSVNDRLGIGRTYEAIGHYQLAQTRLMESTQSHEASLEIFRELNIVPDQAESLINLGFIEYRKGAWEDSLSFLTQAQRMIDEEAEPYKMGQINAGLGEAFLESGLPDVALAKIKLAIEYFRKAQNPRAVSVMFWDLGRAYYELRDYPQALTSLHQALADAEEIDDPSLAALSSEHLGRTYSAMGNSETALHHFKTAFRFYDNLAKKMEAARTSALVGGEYQQQGNVRDAKKHLQSALDTFESLADRLNGSATLYALGKLELTQNNLDLAEDYLRRSIEMTENIRRISTSNDLTAAFSAAVDDRYESYIECLMRQHQAQPGKGFDVRAFEASESSRGRALAEMLRATGANFAPGVDISLIESEKLLRQSLRVREDYKVALLAGVYKREQLLALDTEIAELEKKHNQLIESIQARYPAFKQISRPQAWSLRQIQEQLIDDQTVVLEYSLGENKSYVWAITRNNLVSYELPPQNQIGEQAGKLYKLLTTRPNSNDLSEMTTAARELSRIILSPVAAELNKPRIIIVADGTLNYVPFQILPNPHNDAEILIAGHEIVNAPSTSILGSLRGEEFRKRGQVLAAFGSPVFKSNYSVKAGKNNVDLASLQPVEHERWQQAVRDIELNADSFDPSAIEPLFYAARELANLREVVGATQSMFAIDFEANRDNVLKTDLSQYSILHFATHGLLDPRRPEHSGLLLSTITPDGKPQNGFLSLQDVYQLRAPVNLVVLSACQTGLGKDVRGEGLIGLTRGFMYAGASSVVASLWKVDDEATAELMKRFYANMLEKGMTPAAALREAQNSIRQEPLWRAPYYWAGFTLQGDYHRVVSPNSIRQSYTLVWIATAVVLVIGIALWLYLRRRASRRTTAI
jgi:CHAT domain-containing protein